MSGYTKGEWLAFDIPTGDWAVSTRARAGFSSTGICIVSFQPGSTLANARLISAAPDLYEAARPIVAAFEKYEAKRGAQSIHDTGVVTLQIEAGKLRALQAAARKAVGDE